MGKWWCYCPAQVFSERGGGAGGWRATQASSGRYSPTVGRRSEDARREKRDAYEVAAPAGCRSEQRRAQSVPETLYRALRPRYIYAHIGHVSLVNPTHFHAVFSLSVNEKQTELNGYYLLYNTLEDTKVFLNKQLSLLTSIHDNFANSLSASSSKAEFLQQMESIVAAIRQNKSKVIKSRAFSLLVSHWSFLQLQIDREANRRFGGETARVDPVPQPLRHRRGTVPRNTERYRSRKSATPTTCGPIGRRGLSNYIPLLNVNIPKKRFPAIFLHGCIKLELYCSMWNV